MKHRGLLAKRAAQAVGVATVDAVLRARATDSYVLDHARFVGQPGFFLGESEQACKRAVDLAAAPARVFACWTGPNPMSAQRSRALEALREGAGVPVLLITPDNVGDYIVQDHPLHPAYRHLSYVHRSDYLRAYLMHHHGGGYCDIKRPLSSWVDVFDRVNREAAIWVAGYQERGVKHAAWIPGRFGWHLRHSFPHLVGNAAFICRPRSPLTRAWLSEVERRLDTLADALSVGPEATPMGDQEGYPVGWTYLMAQVFQPLVLEYNDHVVEDERLMVDLNNHR